MRRRSVFLTIFLLVTFASGVTGVMAALLKQEPSFYSESHACASEWESADKGYALVTRVQDLKNDIRSKSEWGASFQTDDVNCFFRETMAERDGLAAFLPPGCHSPRVEIDGDRIRLGMRYGRGFWSTVVWVEMKAWLVSKDINVIALELCGMQAGGLSIGCQSMLDTISEAARESNVDVTWYRREGNPVGLFRFYADQLRPATRIQSFKVLDGTISVSGTTRQEPTVTAMRVGN